MTKLTTGGGCLSIFVIVLWLYTAISYIVNAVKLIKLYMAMPDNVPFLDAIDKHFVIHLVGLIPGFSCVTVWF